jgi:hypothetical protein
MPSRLLRSLHVVTAGTLMLVGALAILNWTADAHAFPTVQCAGGNCAIVDSAYRVPDAGPQSGIGTSPSAVESDPTGTAAQAWEAFQAGQRAYGVALALLVVLVMVRKLWSKPFESDAGGAWFAFGVSMLGAVATSLSTGAPFGWGLVKAGLTVAVLATGGYSVVWKRMLKPLARAAAEKLGLDSVVRALS